ncbi:chorismate mutase [Trinickia symbiotica]|uniref:Chorismate mutase n=1 Tax=Trinickia symbiotica TaxID=863227 RepID=A0A2N7X6C7_9BURK|nr:chorismate mutase [Trinickia symbiotica]PMS37102.1 gamma subclass chorismate mutase AroQ [Trinickia symbiotica]
MKRSLRAFIACLTVLSAAMLASPCNAVADGDDTPLVNLVALASQRLALAVPVAQWKWANHRPITDPPRETALLADVEQRARAGGVDPAFAHAFFQDQIQASKEAQTALFEKWRTSRPPEGPAPDLAASTRPQLDRLTRAMIAALARVQPLRDAPDCPTRLARSVQNWKSMTRYDASEAAPLSTALAHVCSAGGMGGVG